MLTQFHQSSCSNHGMLELYLTRHHIIISDTPHFSEFCHSSSTTTCRACRSTYYYVCNTLLKTNTKLDKLLIQRNSKPRSAGEAYQHALAPLKQGLANKIIVMRTTTECRWRFAPWMVRINIDNGLQDRLKPPLALISLLPEC